MNSRSSSSLFAVWSALALGILCSCAGSSDEESPAAVDDLQAARSLEATLELDESGVSSPLSFVVPPNTRSVTIMAEGTTSQLLALGELRLSDGVDRVGLDLSRSHAQELLTSYFAEESGSVPGSHVVQSARLGTFTYVYPEAPGSSPVAGSARLRVVSSVSSGAIRVRLVMPPDDGANTLHVNVVSISSSEHQANMAWFAAFDRIVGQAGIHAVVDQVVSVTNREYSRIARSTEPQEAPDSEAVAVAAFARTQVQSQALNLILVDELPPGLGGLSLGVPGPVDPASFYYGVIARRTAGAQGQARTLAHEASHFMALQHVENHTLSGDTVPDPIKNTEPGSGNLMDRGGGVLLTAGQAYALRRSALLRLE